MIGGGRVYEVPVRKRKNLSDAYRRGSGKRTPISRITTAYELGIIFTCNSTTHPATHSYLLFHLGRHRVIRIRHHLIRADILIVTRIIVRGPKVLTCKTYHKVTDSQRECSYIAHRDAGLNSRRSRFGAKC